MTAQDNRLTAGFRPGKVTPSVARNRLQAALEQHQELPDSYRALLRDCTLANSLVRVLSEEALATGRQALCCCHGGTELSAAMLLDAREAVRGMGFEWLQAQAPVEAGSAADRQQAARELADLFRPFLEQMQALPTSNPGAPAPALATASAPAAGDSRAPRSVKERELLLALRARDKEAKRYRRDWQAAHEERLRLRQAGESAQAMRANAQAAGAPAADRPVAGSAQAPTGAAGQPVVRWRYPARLHASPHLLVHYSGGTSADRADQHIVAYLRHLKQSAPTQLRAVVTADRSEASQAKQTGALVLALQELRLWLR